MNFLLRRCIIISFLCVFVAASVPPPDRKPLIWNSKKQNGELVALQVGYKTTFAAYFDAKKSQVRFLEFPACMQVFLKPGSKDVEGLEICNSTREDSSDAITYVNLREEWEKNKTMSDKLPQHAVLPRHVLVSAMSQNLYLYWRMHRPKDVFNADTWSAAQRLAVYISLVMKQLPVERIASIIPVIPAKWELDGRQTAWRQILISAGFQAFRSVFEEHGACYAHALNEKSRCHKMTLVIAYIDTFSKQESLILVPPEGFIKIFNVSPANDFTKPRDDDDLLNPPRIRVTNVIISGEGTGTGISDNYLDYATLRRTYPFASIHRMQDPRFTAMRSAAQIMYEQYRSCACSSMNAMNLRCEILEFYPRQLAATYPLFVAGTLETDLAPQYRYPDLFFMAVPTLGNAAAAAKAAAGVIRAGDKPFTVYLVRSFRYKKRHLVSLGKTLYLRIHAKSIDTQSVCFKRPNAKLNIEYKSVPKQRIVKQANLPDKSPFNTCFHNINTNPLFENDDNVFLNYFVVSRGGATGDQSHEFNHHHHHHNNDHDL